jgi:palmitoyltransferase
LFSATFFGLFTAGMTGTSIDLALKNQTQVEKLGAKTRIHILAVLKPSPAELVQLNPVMASEASYPEITYPLGFGMPPPPDRWLPSHGLPVAKVNSHTRQAEPISVPQSNAQNSEQSTALAAQPEGLMKSSKAQEFLELPPPDLNSPTRIPTTASGEVSSRARGEQLTQITAEIADRVELQPEIPARGVALRKEQLSARDLNATRTFAVLKMLEPGDSPWDLGQPLLNWQTVMGINMLDWFLPIRRSPCCKHEDSESQFQIGPAVDYLRARFSFISDADVRAKWGGERYV